MSSKALKSALVRGVGGGLAGGGSTSAMLTEGGCTGAIDDNATRERQKAKHPSPGWAHGNLGPGQRADPSSTCSQQRRSSHCRGLKWPSMDRNPFPASESLASEGACFNFASVACLRAFKAQQITFDLLLCRQLLQSEEAGDRCRYAMLADQVQVVSGTRVAPHVFGCSAALMDTVLVNLRGTLKELEQDKYVQE